MFTESPIWVVLKIMVPFWIPIVMTAPNIQGTQKGTIILTIPHLCIKARG